MEPSTEMEIALAEAESLLIYIAECFSKYHTKNPRAPMALGGLSREEQAIVKILDENGYLKLVKDNGPTPIITRSDYEG